MSEFKHTPGPWEAIGNLVRSPISADEETGGSCGGFLLAEAYGLELTRHTEEAKANARLLAAAPEMLEVLILARKRLACAGFCECAASYSKQASYEDDYRMEQAEIHARIDAAIAKATGTTETVGGGT